jgi:hypothetical protein
MAVRHGYGKIAGADALIFAYDTGDTRNSYKGEPTTNLQAAGGAFGHSSGAYGNVVTVTDATSEKGPGWKKVTISNRGSNFRIIQFTYTSMSANIMYCHSAVFDWGNMRDKGYYIRHDGNGTGTRAFYKPGNYTAAQGASISINSSLEDGKIAGTIIHTASHNHAFFINNNTTGVSGLNDYFYYKEYQVETNTHPTQYTPGTRSATQGLLDLTGKSTVNLTNVSFDSNAQIIFDGSDDYINSSIASLAVFTIETIINRQSIPVNSYEAFLWAISANSIDRISINSNLALIWRVRDSSGNYDNKGSAPNYVTLNKNCHIVITLEGNTIRYYKNGILTDTFTNITFYGNFGGTINIGRNASNSQYFNGKIPMMKIYNRALTADEVRNNYRHYKTRFNI